MYDGALDPVSNREDFLFVREIVDDDTNEAVDISAASITFEIRQSADSSTSTHTPSTTGCSLLSATTANGKITLLDTGVFQVHFTEVEMSGLFADYYDAGCTITINGITTQLLAATLPVRDGIVS